MTRLALLPVAFLLAVSGCDSEGEGPTYSNQAVSIRYVSSNGFAGSTVTVQISDSGEAAMALDREAGHGLPAANERATLTLQPADLVRVKQLAVQADLATLEGPFDCAHFSGCWADKSSNTLEITIDGVTSSVVIDRNIPDEKLPDRLFAVLAQIDEVLRGFPR